MRRPLAIAILATLIVSVGSAVAVQQTGGNPFDQIWAELANLGARVTALESSGGSSSVPHVVDGNGKVVGTLIGADVVLVHFRGRWLRFSIAEDGFRESHPNFIYGTDDCSDLEFLAVGDGQHEYLVHSGSVHSGVGYYPDTFIVFQFFESHSYRDSDGVCIAKTQTLPVVFPRTFDPAEIGQPRFGLVQ